VQVAVREKMVVKENETYTKDYYDLDKRAIGNSIQVHFKDGSSTDRVEIQYPIGHRVRRDEGIPVLQQKFRAATTGLYGEEASNPIFSAFENHSRLDEMPASDFMQLLVRSGVDAATLLA
jgi:2-methylcitrate dehydratase